MLRYFGFLIVLTNILQADPQKEIRFEAGEVHFDSKKYDLSIFYLDQYEVTNSEYLKFVVQSKVNPPLSFAHSQFNGDQQPVSGMDWYDARLYCRIKGKRLPKMIELIRAAQGSIPKVYPFGDDFPSYQKAPFITHSQKPLATTSVTDFAELRSEDDVYQLAGNVAEWTLDAENQPLDSSELKTDGLVKVYGGSYASSVNEVKVGAYRIVDPTENFHLDIGFRCVRSDDMSITPDSNFLSMNSDAIQNLLTGKPQSKKEILNQTTQAKVAKVQAEQKKLDAIERRQKLMTESLALLREREIKVSEESQGATSASIIVPYGFFWLGNNQNKTSAPERLIYLDAFEIDLNLVSSEQFRQYLQNNKTEVVYDYKPRISNPSADLAYVTWDDARSYCKSRQMDLPSEAQWEKSVRGLSEQKEFKVKSDGKSIGYFSIKQIGQGFDEWTQDSFAPYQMSETKFGYRNPVLNLPQGPFKVFRGSAESNQKNSLITDRNASHRMALHPFRCVANLDNAGQPDFEISREMNYFTAEFFESTRAKIMNGENPLKIRVDMGEFELEN